jgi:hypothetical protein
VHRTLNLIALCFLFFLMRAAVEKSQISNQVQTSSSLTAPAQCNWLSRARFLEFGLRLFVTVAGMPIGFRSRTSLTGCILPAADFDELLDI